MHPRKKPPTLSSAKKVGAIFGLKWMLSSQKPDNFPPITVLLGSTSQLYWQRVFQNTTLSLQYFSNPSTIGHGIKIQEPARIQVIYLSHTIKL